MRRKRSLKNLADYIKVYDDILSKEQCDDIIQKFEKADNKEQFDNDLFKFSQLNITQAPGWEDISQEFANDVYSGVLHYFDDLDIPIVPPIEGFEEIRIKKYCPEINDRFDMHVDVNDYKTSRRYLVAFCYLNDCDEGGETSFPTLDISIKPKAGRFLIFPPLWMFPHTGNKPISNDKYIMGTYLHYV